VHRIAARDREKFEDYWADRRRLERRLAGLIRAGTGEGSLREVDPRFTALTIMSNDEGVQNWYRLGPPKNPGRVARSLAQLTVAGLLPDAGRMAEIAARVEAIDKGAGPR